VTRSGGGDLAFVVQRYGEDVTGGSETLARALAERLAAERAVTVFTTCARDYVTWRNELPMGTSTVGPVTVRRFAVEEERDLAAFNRYSESLYGRPHTEDDEWLWLRRQGPYVPALVRALGEEHERFAAVVFFTYLYYPTCEGLRAAAARSLLVPTCHDEPPLRFSLYDEVFARPRAFAFLTAAEEALVRGRFALGARPGRVAGMGVDEGPDPDVGAFRARHGVGGRYLAYAGRIDAGKGCLEMLAHYDRFRRESGRQVELLLLGRMALPAPLGEGVRYLGFLPEEEKRAALRGADVVLCPSPYESLSIVMLEAFALGTPALANARSPVLVDHCRRANAGLFYEDGDEFVEALAVLLRDRALREAMGERGRAYVHENYAWDKVLARYRSLITAAANDTTTS
jgi:glycosyltransferase involved in cell wall biosynthesis